MSIIETIKLALEQAVEDRNKVATFHSLVLINAKDLENLDPQDFCKKGGLSEGYKIEFQQMIAISRKLSDLEYSIRKNDAEV